MIQNQDELFSKSQYELASTAAVLNGVVFGFIDELSQWFENKGLSSNQARDIVIHTLRSATGLADFKQNQTLKEINNSIATSGTYTKRAQELIIEKNGFKSWTDTCSLIQKELTKPL
ncbi:pyrroline-5-carboxylate reductase dimerization domain-containing protein [Campylobacterota bacterium DY0563]